MIVWRDGDFVGADGAVSATDRCFLVGDGVFETLLVENGRPAFLAAHLERLVRGLMALGIDAVVDERELRHAIAGLADRNGVLGRAACRITATRVGGARGLVASAGARAQMLMTLGPAPPRSDGLRAIIAGVRRYSQAPTNSFKCVGAYAANMLARMEAATAGTGEAIMLNEHGRAASASSANLFVIKGDTIITPPESEGAMPGVTRSCLIDIARRLGAPVRIEPIEASALGASPLLFTNSIIGLAPGRIGAAYETPHDLAARLGAAYEATLDAEFREPTR